MTKPFRPMLASPANLETLKFPCEASVKLDGIRCLGMNGVAMSRSMKPIPNKHIQSVFADGRYDGYDGELIVGSPTATDVYRTTNSAVMSIEGKPDFTFYTFDRWDRKPGEPLRLRISSYDSYATTVEHIRVESLDDLLDYEIFCLRLGYEGVMIRGINSPYKQGRSTVKEGYLLKLKRFADAEFKVVGFEELMHNENEATVDALGHTVRSYRKGNMVGGNTLGALILEYGDRTFRCGTGFDAADRAEIWANQDAHLGRLAKVKFFQVGMKDLPRHPVFLGWRTEEDM